MGLLSAGTIAILIGLDLANADGLTSPLIVALLAGGVALLVVFALAERRRAAAPWCPAMCCATGCSRPRAPRSC